MQSLEGRSILVTGGVGSVGRVLVERCLEDDPAVVRVLDLDETGLFNLRAQVGDDRLRYLVGDVRDPDRLELAMQDVDVVFHAAALKHVELSEYNPFEAVKTNVLGAQNVIRSALRADVETVINVSTDKASMPVSVMGATKLLTERLFSAGNVYSGLGGTRYASVRFGNVFDSAGSVVRVFRRQIAAGGPVTVTDPEMTRFVMPTEQAVELVLDAARTVEGGEVYVLKMPSIRIGDLARTMIAELADEPEAIEIEVVGPRPAERMHEKLISAEEATQAVDRGRMFVIIPMTELGSGRDAAMKTGTPVGRAYTSADQEPLDSEAIAALLRTSDP